MNEEYGLFILWENARYNQNKIIEDINNRFKIINLFNISWDKEKFGENLSRFYGENLQKNSFKEKECGSGAFLLIIVKDPNPIYLYRKTSKGRDLVNVNFFDIKDLYRNWTMGGHKVHSSNNLTEFRHDLMMLLGVNISDYEKKYYPSHNIINYNQNLIGSEGWNSLEEVFYVLNETTDYLVLRNYYELPEKYIVGNHGDIDILTSNYYNIQKILNAKAVSKQKTRVRNIITIKNENVYFDFRYIGDNYYDKNWEISMLKNRIKYKKIYVPDKKNFNFSLLYHALIHKKYIASDYINILNSFTSVENYIKDLFKFLDDNNYKVENPIDISVFFNSKNAKKKNNLKKIIYFKLFIILNKINLD